MDSRLAYLKNCSENLVVFSGTRMHHAVPLKNWLVVYPVREKDVFRQAKSTIMRVASEFGLEPSNPRE